MPGMVNKTFEIQYVEHEQPFYQLGNQYVWGLRCELFEYGDEDIDTGVAAVDAIQTNFASAISVVMAEGGSGIFTVGETVTGGTSATTAEVKAGMLLLELCKLCRSGGFRVGETITGNDSTAVWTTYNYNTLNNVNDEFDITGPLRPRRMISLTLLKVTVR